MSPAAHGLDPRALEEVAGLLARARSVLFVTGAGISADSGLPTYRGVGGLYEDAETEDGIAIEDALSGEMFAARPEVSWRHIAQIERACRGARPNRAHEVIAEIGRHIPRTWVLTQNVDGLHTAAGSQHVIEIHGDVHRLVCPRCGYRTRVNDFEGLAIPPSCPECGAVIRPEVVLFGEELPLDALWTLRQQLHEGFDLVFSIGTSSLFPYITRPVLDAASEGTPTVEVNPGSTVLSGAVRYRLRARAATAMNAVWRAYEKLRGSP